MTKTVFNEISELERRLGLPKDFYMLLLNENDWSFVIKLNALFEATCTHVLSVRLKAPELTEAFSHLELAGTKTGKTEILKSLCAIYPEQTAILRSLAELRNRLVHRIENVSFSFDDYVLSLDRNQFGSFVRSFGHGLAEVMEVGEKKIPKAQFVRENPKLSLWLTAAEVLACLHLEFQLSEIRLKRAALNEYMEIARRSSVTSDNSQK